MDTFSEVISFLRPKAVITGITEGHAPWGLRFSGYDYVKFGFISEGSCWLRVQSGPNIRLEEGDAWILIRPLEFWIGSDDEARTELSQDFYKIVQPRYVVGKPDVTSEKSVIYGGGLYFDSDNSSLVLGNLPSVIVLKKAKVSSTLKSILGIMQEESQTMAMGGKVVMESLIQLIFVEAIRTLDMQDLKLGFLKGMSDAKIKGVIDAIHKDYKKDWSVNELAKVYRGSRSSFAAHFKSSVGLSPMEYLQQWRMVHAKEALRSGHMRISEIADSVGYESVTAFSTAFSKVVGQGPKSFRDAHRLD